MSTPTYIIMPVQEDGPAATELDSAKIASAIQETIGDKKRDSDGIEQGNRPSTLVREHQDSLYRYISWEDPLRTLGAYIGCLLILLGAHHIPLTKMALKFAAATLGVISIAGFASRSFGPNTFLTRLRPETYKHVPEPMLNATLRDIHDLIQYAAVKLQRIVFCESLYETSAAFACLTALYFLGKLLNPFSLAVLGLTLLFMVPLITSPRGRQLGNDAKVRAGEMANTVTAKGSGLYQDGKSKAAELSNRGRDAAADTGRQIESVVQSGRQSAVGQSTNNPTADPKASEAGPDEFERASGHNARLAEGYPIDANPSPGEAQYVTSASYAATDHRQTNEQHRVLF